MNTLNLCLWVAGCQTGMGQLWVLRGWRGTLELGISWSCISNVSLWGGVPVGYFWVPAFAGEKEGQTAKLQLTTEDLGKVSPQVSY